MDKKLPIRDAIYPFTFSYIVVSGDCGLLSKINKIFVLACNFCNPQTELKSKGNPKKTPSIWTLEMYWQKQSERWGLDPVWWDCSHLQPWWWLSAWMWVWPHWAKQPCPEGWVTMSLLSTQTLLPLSSSFPLLLSSTGHHLLVHYSVTKPQTFFLFMFHTFIDTKVKFFPFNFRNRRPPLTISLLCKFFLLSLAGYVINFIRAPLNELRTGFDWFFLV